MVRAPIYTTAKTVEDVPYLYSETFTLAPGGGGATSETAVIVVAPLNDMCGSIYRQPASPPNTTTALSGGIHFYDTYVSDILTPTTTSGASNVQALRYTSMCVELVVTQALASVQNCFRVLRWTGGGVPVVSNQAAEFFSTYSVVTNSDPYVLGAGELVSSHCIPLSMRDRQALEFCKPAIGWSSWVSEYSPGTDITGSLARWDPLIITATTSSPLTFTLTVRGSLDLQPFPNKGFWRMGKVPLPPANGQEEAWWAQQRRLGTMPPYALRRTDSRSVAGYVGKMNTPAPTDKANTNKKSAGGVVKNASRAMVAALAGGVLGMAANRAAAGELRRLRAAPAPKKRAKGGRKGRT